MKYVKQYTFLFMIVLSSIIYGGVKLVMAVGQYQSQIYAVEMDARQRAAVEAGRKVEVLAIAESESGTQMNLLFVEEAQNSGLPESEPQSELQSKPELEPEPEYKKFQRVELDYLEDALFIGDSRTSTLYEYADWQGTDFFVKYGLTVWDVWEKDMDGKTLEEILTAKCYGKIYIMLGINELGRGTPESFREQYGQIVEKIRKLQPEAVVYVEAIMHVTANKDAEGTYINNEEINARNLEIQKLTDGQAVYWLDVNAVTDEPGTGTLREEYSFDGVHLQVKYIGIWQEYLLDHGIVI